MVKIKETDAAGGMFWGVVIESGKKYSQTVAQGFHVSMAALDLSSGAPKESVQVMLQRDSTEFLLCTLDSKDKQERLDLYFETGEEVTFCLNGSGTVHMTGYLMSAEYDYQDESVSDMSDSDEEVPSLIETPDSSLVATGGKRKKMSDGGTPKKMKVSTMLDEVDSEDDEDDEDFSDDFDEDEFSDDSDVESEDDDDEDEEEEDDEDEEEQVQQKKTPAKNTPQAKKSDAKQTPKSANKKDSTAKQNTPATKQEQPSNATQQNGETESAKKKKKKNKNKDKSMNDSTASTPSQSPKVETTTTPKKRVVAGGTIVEDVKIGHGPEAKPGKMVSVYYVGTLAKTQKRFDSCQGGKPFRFRLSKGEVIKGWDTGVQGMKVGGKRKLTVPANQGYGNMKQGPIPANSTLVFEVELKAVN